MTGSVAKKARLQGARGAAIGLSVRIRFLLAMLIGLALSLAPLAMPPGAAMAAAPAHHGEMAGMEHCDDAQPVQSQKDSHGKTADKPCCVAGCMVATSMPAPADDMVSLPRLRERPAADRFRPGYLVEIATPPPRLS